MKIKALISVGCRSLASLGLVALMIVSSLTVVDAIMRRFFARNIDGLSDVVEWCIIVAVSACIPAMLLGRHAITVRVVGQLLPWRWREALELLGDTLLLAVIAVIAWQMCLYSYEIWDFGDVSPLKGWVKWPVWFLASALWIFAVIVQFAIWIEQFARLCAKVEPEVLQVQESL